jgi:hypothetical protein
MREEEEQGMRRKRREGEGRRQMTAHLMCFGHIEYWRVIQLVDNLKVK